jgi:hypothetical protein
MEQLRNKIVRLTTTCCCPSKSLQQISQCFRKMPLGHTLPLLLHLTMSKPKAASSQEHSPL